MTSICPASQQWSDQPLRDGESTGQEGTLIPFAERIRRRNVEAGKKKKTDDLSERAKRCRHKNWRDDGKKKQKNREITLKVTATTPDSPESQSPGLIRPGPSRFGKYIGME